jgi:hypothetical protein
MIYIKDNITNVILAGNVIDEDMQLSGFVPYEGVIPLTSEFEKLQLLDNVLVIKKDEEKIKIVLLPMVKDYINTIAKKFNLSNIDEIVKFLGFDNDYRNLAEALASWNASVLSYTNTEINKFLNDERKELDSTSFIKELPKFRDIDIFKSEL